jgi:hypothetical protein
VIKIGDHWIEFCLFADCTEANVGILNNIWIAHEVHLNETANTHNSRIWGTEIANLQEDDPLRPSNCTLRCAVSTTGIAGLVLLQQNVTSECHRTLVEENFTPQSQEKGCDFNKIFLHQDGV